MARIGVVVLLAGAAARVSAAPDAASAAGALEIVKTEAVEVRIEGVETAAQIGGRQARPGYEFVIVDTTWKNIIPLTAVPKKRDSSGLGGFGGFGSSRKSDPSDVTMESTAYAVPSLKRHFWLLTDDRFADPVDIAANDATPGHLPDGFAIAKLDETLRGKVVFEAPVQPKHRVFQFYDTNHGNVIVTLSGTKPAAPAAIAPARENTLLRLAVTEASSVPGEGVPAGLRRYVVGLRGSSLSPKDIVDVPFQQFVFALTNEGCVARPEQNPVGLSRPFGAMGSFLPGASNEGQVSFLLPESTKSFAVQVRAANSGPLDLPAAADFAAKWPTPVHTFVDGTTMRVHLLPRPKRPAGLSVAVEGTQEVLLDVVVENLSPRSGIEFQAIQLRLAMEDGRFVDPSPRSASVPCRLDEDGVIPAAGVRRFMFVYDVRGGGATRVHYRGFELQEEMAALP